MDLTIDQASLARSLRWVGRIASSRSTLPILQGVLLDASDTGLTLTATDGDLGVTTTLPAEVVTLGRLALPARLLSEYVAHLPAHPVRLSLDTACSRVHVSCGATSAHIGALPADEFPVLPEPRDDWAFDLDARKLQQAVARVAFATAHDSSRPVLSAVLFDFGPHGLTLAAADGFRLARALLHEATGSERSLLVPERAVAEFDRLLGEATTARLALTGEANGLTLTVGPTRLFTRLVDGRFPNIARIIPSTWQTRVVVETRALRQAVKVASLFGAQGDAKPVMLMVEGEGVVLRARGDETGEARSALPATVEGEAQGVALNTRLLTDLLEAVSAPEVELRWVSPQTPVVIQGIDERATEDIWVVMPLHDPKLLKRTPTALQEA